MSNILNLQLHQYWDNSDLTSMAVVNVMKNINVAKLEVLGRSASAFCQIFIWKDVWFHWGALWKLWNVDFCSLSASRAEEWVKCIIWFGHQAKRSKTEFRDQRAIFRFQINLVRTINWVGLQQVRQDMQPNQNQLLSLIFVSFESSKMHYMHHQILKAPLTSQTFQYRSLHFDRSLSCGQDRLTLHIEQFSWNSTPYPLPPLPPHPKKILCMSSWFEINHPTFSFSFSLFTVTLWETLNYVKWS